MAVFGRIIERLSWARTAWRGAIDGIRSSDILGYCQTQRPSNLFRHRASALVLGISSVLPTMGIFEETLKHLIARQLARQLQVLA